jgi:hypothetical protein
VVAEYPDGVLQRGVGGELVGHVPAAVVADDLYRAEAGVVQAGAEVLVPAGVVTALVPAAEVADVDAVALGAVQPGDVIVDHVLRPEVAAADPAGRGPGQGDDADVRVAGQGLLAEPELVAHVAVDVPADVLVAGLGAVGGVGVAADLELQQLNRGAVAGLEQVVEDLGALWLGVVDEEAGVASAAADGADAVERASDDAAIDGDVRGCRGRGCRDGQYADRGGSQGEGCGDRGHG